MSNVIDLFPSVVDQGMFKDLLESIEPEYSELNFDVWTDEVVLRMRDEYMADRRLRLIK